MVLYSTVARWRTCWGMIDVIRPHCVSGGVFSCHEAPPLIPGADGSLRYFSASPPPPSLCLNPRRRAGLARENKNCFPRFPFQIYHSCQLNTGRWKIRPRKLNLSPSSHNPCFILPTTEIIVHFLMEIGEAGGAVGHECCYNARRCKERGLAIKGNALYFSEFFRWLACFLFVFFRGAVWSLHNLIINTDTIWKVFRSRSTPPETSFYQTEVISIIFRYWAKLV